MIIDTVISKLIDAIKAAGYSTTNIPIARYIERQQMLNDIIAVWEQEQYYDAAYIEGNYMITATVNVDILSKTNDHSISVDRMHKMRDSVLAILSNRNIYNCDLSINRITNDDAAPNGTCISSIQITVMIPAEN